MRGFSLVAVILLLFGTAAFAQIAKEPVKVGSKKFTEAVILGDMASQLAGSAGTPVEHKRELGGTRVLWNALLRGDIDIYAEYTGTLIQEILADEGIRSEAQLVEVLREMGLRISRPLGFNNTYAIGMKEEVAERLRIRTISDLRHHPELHFGFSNEFMDRDDGWPNLRGRYGLPQQEVRGLEHNLAYRALESGDVAITDLYSTDAEIAYYSLRVLKDDLGHFPKYEALWLYRADLAERMPKVVAALRGAEGRIPEAVMVRMNARVKIDKVPESEVAADFLREHLGLEAASGEKNRHRSLWFYTREHLLLVGVSLGAAILFAIPLGILAWRRPRLGQLILGAAGIIQTIPTLALLVFMIPLLGIGGPPAIAALFLYSLLPIIRNTHAGLSAISGHVRESAEAIGLPPGARLRLVELPLASRTILAGIKISAVINVGTATLGALIGAGGYGQPILTGIRLDDLELILLGAVPAALLALLVQGGFELAERFLVPKGLRLKPE